MGDEPSKMDASVAAPASRKREIPDADCCNSGDLERVAEIVMVLEIMGRMRGGSDPTAVEKGLAAEARRKLVTMCESFKPNDLFTSDAARILAGDLGFNPAKDQIGNRPIRKQLPIAEKITITKKKMEESREFKVQTSPHPPPHPTVGVGMKQDHRAVTTTASTGPHRVSSDKQNQIPTPIGGFQQGSPSTLTSNSSFKMLPLNDMHKSLTTSKSAGGPAEAPHIRVDPRTGGLPHPVQVQGNHLLDRKSTSATYQSIVAKPSQVVNVIDRGAAKVEVARSVNPYKTSSQVVKDQVVTGPPPGVIQGNIQNTGQQSHESHPVATVASSEEIAVLIHRLLQPKPTNLSSWSPPSTNYMSKPLHCQVCRINITDSESLLVCDACEKGTHLGCLKLLSQRAVSNVEWYCPSCLHSSNGKPFPPKYGRVTRSHSAARTSNPGGVATVPEKPTGSSVPKASHQTTVPMINVSCSKPATLNATSSCLELTEAVKKTNAMEGRLKPALAHHNDHKDQTATCTNQTEGEDGSSNSCSIPNETSSQVSLTTDTSVTNPASVLTTEENTNMQSDLVVENTKVQSDSVVHPDAGQHSYCLSSTQGTDSVTVSVALDV